MADQEQNAQPAAPTEEGATINEQPTTTSAEDIPFKDPEAAEIEFKISKDINAMPEGVKDRFKALKVLTDKLHELDEEEDQAYRALERKYELLYQKVYEKRAALVMGEQEPQQAQQDKFEEMKTSLTDEAFETLEVPICDVKDIQNTVKGVSGFWLRAMLAHTNLQHEITEKDRSILAYLQDIRLTLHDSGFGFNLTFVFEENAYFAGTELTKQFVMTKPNVVEKCVGTNIVWTAGSDPTKEKKKKKTKSGGKTKTVTTTVKCDSFFNFFETVEAADLGNKQPSGDSDSDDDENKIGEQMDHDFDMGNDIKDDIVPLALEYYLGVIEKEEEDDDEDDDDDDEDSDGPKQKKQKKMKVAPGGGPKGPNGEECKQQ